MEISVFESGGCKASSRDHVVHPSACAQLVRLKRPACSRVHPAVHNSHFEGMYCRWQSIGCKLMLLWYRLPQLRLSGSRTGSQILSIRRRVNQCLKAGCTYSIPSTPLTEGLSKLTSKKKFTETDLHDHDRDQLLLMKRHTKHPKTDH